MHDVLRWANRRAVAEEVTRRGYRVSGETLNRWVRDEKEFPAVVERIVFDLFTISGHESALSTEVAEGLAARVADDVVERITAALALPLEELAEATDRRLAQRLEASLRTPDEPASGPADEPAVASPGSRRRTSQKPSQP